jgi:hypothetical protein
MRDGDDDQFECEYRGAFRSGKSVGPVTNGALCKALGADDYHEGIQLTVVRRRASPKIASAETTPAEVMEAATARARRIGPKFSIFRENAHQ